MKNVFIELYEFMEELMDENDLDEFRKSDIYHLDYYNFSLRQWLCDRVLKDGSDFYNFFMDLDIEDKNDMANELIEGFFVSLNSSS